MSAHGERPPPGEIFIISAPSGTGKTTLIRTLMEERLRPIGGVEHSTSHTTRRARPEEVDGRDYHFVDDATFDRMVAEDLFLEWAEYNGRRYGTSKQEVLPRLEAGVDVVLDIEVKGARKLLRRHPEAHGIFVVPPSFEALEERLRRRAQDPDAEISRRLAVSLWEIERYELYEYVIINDDLERASLALASIILEKRHRLPRIAPKVRSVLESFAGVAASGRTEDPGRTGGAEPE
ncbi:MAG: guanylate kinase [Thermoanaerobaculia bacterium]|nr:guanylate kinase [Thermoanaerobaculia bacterium]